MLELQELNEVLAESQFCRKVPDNWHNQAKFSVNTKLVNKPPKGSKQDFTSFYPRTGGIKEILSAVKNGHAISAATYKDNYRLKGNVISNGLWIGDIDEGITIDEFLKLPLAKFCLIYTSPSHKPEHHKFRIISFLPSPNGIDSDTYESLGGIINDLIGGYLDSNAMEAGRMFYGNSQGEIFNDNPFELPRRLIKEAEALAQDKKEQKKKAKADREAKAKEYKSSNENHQDVTRDEIPLALNHINPDRGYDEWLTVGFALYHQFNGSDEGFILFDQWSSKGSKYDGTEALHQKWQSFGKNTPDPPITIASLFKLAFDNGYKSPVSKINKNTTNIKKKVKEIIENIENNSKSSSSFNFSHWCEESISAFLAEEFFKGSLIWDQSLGEWLKYSVASDGIWTVAYKESIQSEIAKKLVLIADIIALNSRKDNKPPKPKNISKNTVDSVEVLLRGKLAIRTFPKTPRHLLPLENGVLDLIEGKLMPYQPEFYFKWRLPYPYLPKKDCPNIKNWLKETVKDDGVVQLLRAYLKAIVTGRVDMQKYLELIGPGGTGKSTFLTLAQALIGNINCHITTLKSLESSRFETSSIFGKRLVLITDSERWTGSAAILKALTGQDRLPFEQKFKQPREGFTPEAMVLIAANETIQSSDYTSGLARRRITVPFTETIDPKKQKELIVVEDDLLRGEFALEIPALLNWVLELTDEQMRAYLKNTKEIVPCLNQTQYENLIESNSIANWAEHCLKLDPHVRTHVGKKSGNSQNFLYPSYVIFCEETGLKALSAERFSKLLADLFDNQLNLGHLINRGRSKKGSFFEGISIRFENDDSPTIGEILSKQQKKQPTPSKNISNDTNDHKSLPTPPQNNSSLNGQSVKPSTFQPPEIAEQLKVGDRIKWRKEEWTIINSPYKAYANQWYVSAERPNDRLSSKIPLAEIELIPW